MSNSRRRFLQSSAALAAGVMSGAAKDVLGETEAQAAAQTADRAPQVQIPKIKFGGVEIGRMVMGVNPLYGFGHFNTKLDAVMRDWYTPEQVCEVLHRANKYGINAFNWVRVPRSTEDLARFEAEGGKMHLIIQATANDDAAALVKEHKPLALQRRGGEIDRAFQNGTMAAEREWCKKARDLGVLVGVGTHKPAVIEMVEEQGWDIDFYSGCVYNVTRTNDEWRKALNGELMELSREIYMESDPARMYKVMRQTKKPCFAYKILAAGRIEGKGVEQAFRTAFASIKPQDGVYVGMFPRFKDEVRENAEIVHRILTGA